MDYMLEVEGLGRTLESENNKDFKLEDVSFKLKSGYIMGLIGPNGSGKTSTIKLIMNLLKKDCGKIFIFGKDNILQEVEIKNRIGFVYEDMRFFENLSIKDMTSLIRPFYSRWDHNIYKSYINRFYLDENQKIKQLSKGMRMKYSLALALSHDAELLILDEPSSGLDPSFRKELLDILQDYIVDGRRSVFLSTHITKDLDKIGDYITYLINGRVKFTGRKDLFLENHKIIKGYKKDLDKDIRKKLIGFKERNLGYEALINCQDLDKIDYDEIILENSTIEDIMYYFERQEKHIGGV